jgi:hypothetical protein
VAELLDAVAQLEHRGQARVEAPLDLLQARGGRGDRVQVVQRAEQQLGREEERVHGVADCRLMGNGRRTLLPNPCRSASRRSASRS